PSAAARGTDVGAGRPRRRLTGRRLILGRTDRHSRIAEGHFLRDIPTGWSGERRRHASDRATPMGSRSDRHRSGGGRTAHQVSTGGAGRPSPVTGKAPRGAHPASSSLGSGRGAVLLAMLLAAGEGGPALALI